MLAELIALDYQVFHTINSGWRSTLLDHVMPVFSNVLVMWALLLGGFGFCLRHVRKEGRPGLRMAFGWLALLALTLGLTELGVNGVKGHAGRVRPYHSLAGIHYLDEHRWEKTPELFLQTKARGDSFYSAHATNSMAIAVVVGTLCPPAGAAVYFLPLAVGCSRVYLGRHYPVDVIIGWIAGWIIATCMCRLGRRFGLRPLWERKKRL